MNSLEKRPTFSIYIHFKVGKSNNNMYDLYENNKTLCCSIEINKVDIVLYSR